MTGEVTREQAVEALRFLLDAFAGGLTNRDREMSACLRFALRELEAGGWRAGGTIITVDMTGEEDDAQRVYDLIEETLYDNGQIGTLSMCVSPPSDGGGENDR